MLSNSKVDTAGTKLIQTSFLKMTIRSVISCFILPFSSYFSVNSCGQSLHPCFQKRRKGNTNVSTTGPQYVGLGSGIHYPIWIGFGRIQGELLHCPSLKCLNSPPFICMVILDCDNSLWVYIMWDAKDGWLKLTFVHSYWSDCKENDLSGCLNMRTMLPAVILRSEWNRYGHWSFGQRVL